MDPSRVLFLITSSGTGGAEHLAKQVILRLDRKAFEPFFCSLRSRGTMARALADAGVPVSSFDMSESVSILEMFRVQRRLRSLLRRHRIDLVMTSLYRANVLGPLAVLKGRNRTRVVTSQHSLAPLAGTLPVLLTRWSHRVADRVVAVSEAVRRYMVDSEAIPDEKVVVIPNGVDTQRYRRRAVPEMRRRLGLTESDVVIGAAGRLSKVKGFDGLIEAVRHLSRSGLQPRLLIAGEGPERSHLQELIAQSELEERVKILGLREDMPLLYSVFDLFVLSSHREGSPGVVLEAMASECPVVATAVGGVPEMIEGGISGELVPPDDPVALARALGDLIQDRSRRRALAERARKRVEEEFDLDRITRRYEVLFTETLSS